MRQNRYLMSAVSSVFPAHVAPESMGGVHSLVGYRNFLNG